MKLSGEEARRVLAAGVPADMQNGEILPISAKNKFGVDMLLKRIKELMPESPAFFDKDHILHLYNICRPGAALLSDC